MELCSGIDLTAGTTVHDAIFCCRKQDCSPAESAAIMEEVRTLEALLKQV